MITIAPWRAWLRCLHAPQHAEIRLVCFPPAGGAVSFFRPWTQHSSIELWAVQYPGREDRLKESGAQSVMETSRRAMEALQWLGDRPFALFGHSMGALVAFEAARRLELTGQPGPVHLFASSCVAPIRHQGRAFNRDDEQEVIAELRRLGWPSRMLGDGESRSLILPPARDDLHMFYSYEYTGGRPVSCPITVLAGDSDPEVPVTGASEWSRHTTERTDVIAFPGGHWYLAGQEDKVMAAVVGALSTM